MTQSAQTTIPPNHQKVLGLRGVANLPRHSKARPPHLVAEIAYVIWKVTLFINLFIFLVRHGKICFFSIVGKHFDNVVRWCIWLFVLIQATAKYRFTLKLACYMKQEYRKYMNTWMDTGNPGHEYRKCNIFMRPILTNS